MSFCKKHNFLKDIRSKIIRDVDSKIFSMTLTLLPHQLFILPENYKSALDRNFLDNKKFQLLDDNEIR